MSGSIGGEIYKGLPYSTIKWEHSGTAAQKDEGGTSQETREAYFASLL